MNIVDPWFEITEYIINQIWLLDTIGVISYYPLVVKYGWLENSARFNHFPSYNLHFFEGMFISTSNWYHFLLL